MTREEIVNEYFTKHRYDILLNPYAGLLDFAKYLDEHSELPEDLEEAARVSAYSITPTWPESDIKSHIKGFIAGAKWDRAKMMEKAISGRYMKAGGKVYVESWLLDIDPDSVKAGDEVRLIVIPEEK